MEMKMVSSSSQAQHVPQPPLDKDYLVQRRPNLGNRSSSTTSISQIEEMVSDDRLDNNTYGVSELREGFFDAFYHKPTPLRVQELRARGLAALPDEFTHGESLLHHPVPYVQQQWRKIILAVTEILTTRSGIRLSKAFLAFFTAYVLCLVPMVREWLGRYSYIMVVSTIINHPARTVGSQIDGAVLTTVGTAAGLGWGAVGLLLSTSTLSASAGFGGILALFLALFMFVIAWMRSFLVRLYQGVLCAGIAITFTALAQTSARNVEWPKLRSYGIPWVLGQAIALVVNCVIFPDAGARPLAVTLHSFFDVAQEALLVPRHRDAKLNRKLAEMYIDVSTAYRDLRLDLTITRFRVLDVKDVRNLMLDIIRSLLSLDTDTSLFNNEESDEAILINIHPPASKPDGTQRAFVEKSALHENPLQRVTHVLSTPTRSILNCIREGLDRSDAALMGLSGYRTHLGPPAYVSADLKPIQDRLQEALTKFDAAEALILDSGGLPLSSTQDPDVVKLFVFGRAVREIASHVQALLDKVNEMQHKSDWPRLHLPSYPLSKAIHRTNKQIRHDRGGITAGSYHITFAEIAQLLDKITSRDHRPSARTRPGTPDDDTIADTNGDRAAPNLNAATGMPPKRDESGANHKRDALGYRVWRVMHRLQGFESRYAFKACLVTSILSVPSYLNGTDWWDRYDAWWAVSMSWIMIHPRVGGNAQDLIIRSFCAVLGALWSGAAHAAGGGSPYVVAVFAAIYMIPMLHRFIHSSHPRSGLVGCLSFTVISLGLQYHDEDDSSAAVLAIAKGLSFFVGTAVPVIVNWVVWPFVARHEVRFALSSMLFFMSVIYRNVVAKYVYFEQGKEPTKEDIQRSEILEGRLREGFVRVRQLIILTRHEIRLRESFDPFPYAALADACERFLDYLIAVRQSAIHYNPDYIRGDGITNRNGNGNRGGPDAKDASEKLLGYRRDAVAALLGNLYILAGALRSRRPVPRYLPSGAAARKKLLVRTAELEREMAAGAVASTSGDGRSSMSELPEKQTWADIYSYSYKESLTGCVAQLEELEKYTKLIVGEQGFDDDTVAPDENEEAHDSEQTRL